MTGIEKLREYAGNLKCTDMYYAVGTNIESLADQIERETLPRPLFEDGEPVQFGDEFPGYGGSIIVDCITFYRDCNFSLSDAFGRDWLFDAGDRVKRHAPKVIDADGTPINIADTVWDVRGLGPYTVHSFEKGGSSVYVDEPERCGIKVQHMVKPDTLTHKEPEPPDSWERIEDDAKKDPCDYFCQQPENTCEDCPSYRESRSCLTVQCIDLVRRCRALAEKEAGR